MNKIICISREFGSGGHDIGLTLAKKLYIPFYDRTLSEVGASNIGIDISKLDDIDEKASNSLMYSLVMGNTLTNTLGTTTTNITVQDRLFAEQSRLIEEYAKEGPCVIVGRCSGYILRNNPNALSIFICRDYDKRIERVMENYDLNETAAINLIKKKDKSRATYVQHYTTAKWGASTSYDICINSSKFGINGSVDLIEKIVSE